VDVTATGLLELVTRAFNEGRDHAGSPIGEPTTFFVGAAVSFNAPDLEREVRLLRRKVEAGAAFVLSQPVYDAGPVTRFREAYEAVNSERLSLPLLIGVLPLVTLRHAEFLHNEVPGIVIPERTRERLRVAGDAAWSASLAMVGELLGDLRAAGVAGVYVMPQFGRYDLAAEVVDLVRGAGR
jgi:5,10-methylenetetrahydrofolate reductase